MSFLVVLVQVILTPMDELEGRSTGQYRFGKNRASAIIMRYENLSTSKGPDATSYHKWYYSR